MADTKVTGEIIAEMIRMEKEGMNYHQIAEKTGLHWNTVQRNIAKYKAIAEEWGQVTEMVKEGLKNGRKLLESGGKGRKEDFRALQQREPG